MTPGSITIISGCPASGKSTLARRTAGANPDTVHLRTDDFYTAITNLIDPSLPEAKQQNENIVRQFSAVASSLSEDGHNVLIDGVVGPWMLPIVKEQIMGFSYLVLHPDVEEVVRRGAARIDQPVPERAIRKMHLEFEKHCAGFEKHYVTELDYLDPDSFRLE